MFEEVSHIHFGLSQRLGTSLCSCATIPCETPSCESTALRLHNSRLPDHVTSVDQSQWIPPLAGLVCPPYTHIGNSWCLWWLAGNPDWQYQSTLTNKTQLFILFSHFFQPLMIDIYWQQQVCTERAMSVLTKTRTCLDMLSMWYSLKYHENTKMITKFMYSILKCY